MIACCSKGQLRHNINYSVPFWKQFIPYPPTHSADRWEKALLNHSGFQKGGGGVTVSQQISLNWENKCPIPNRPSQFTSKTKPQSTFITAKENDTSVQKLLSSPEVHQDGCWKIKKRWGGGRKQGCQYPWAHSRWASIPVLWCQVGSSVDHDSF